MTEQTMETIAQLSRRQVVALSGMAGRMALVLLMLTAALMAASGIASAAPVSDVRMTKHNLSKFQKGATANPNTTKSTTEDQVCVFCHTPHAATSGVNPLWNRSVSSSGYTRYTSASLDASSSTDYYNSQPAGSSLLCLSCHDGQVALGNVNVLNGVANAQISVNGATTTKMPAGNFDATATTGYTRHLGTDLSNDHPISITFNDAVAELDGELQRMTTAVPKQRDTITGELIGIRQSGYKPTLPLQPTGTVAGSEGQIQCSTCHDPHLYDADDPKRKFLRLNRLQANAAPASGGFSESNDIICLACHTKSYTSWGQSAHANETVADESYTAAAAALRDFPSGTKVWQAACLNCHDNHAVQGTRRLLREGRGDDATDVVATGAASGAVFQAGGASVADNSTTSAIETTCFQCHRDAGGINALTAASGSTVPSIKSLFDLEFGMPVKTADQATNSREVHNITNADLQETQANLGYGSNANRHAECPDCHNPHRLRRGKTFDVVSSSSGDGALRTHQPGTSVNGNIASGVLRGGWGVEPTFVQENEVFPKFPSGFTVKKGDPGSGAAPATRADSLAASYLTREYQLCFKCHSNYANGETKASFAPVEYASNGSRRGTPLTRANGMTRYTNVAAEFGSVVATDPATSGTDQGEFANSTYNQGTACDGGDCAPRTNAYGAGNYNHRSWHPVVFPTGRDKKERRMTNTAGTTVTADASINLRPPFVANIGVQTMHCSDCHGQSASWTAGVGPTAGTVQGPHGSDQPFLLRGVWTSSITLSNVNSSSPSALCGNCHQPRVDPGSGWSGTGFNPRHQPDGNMSGLACMRCHIAVPHGWRNKAFLVNLRCVGTEVSTLTGNCNVVRSAYKDTTAYTGQPYYYQSRLQVTTWRRSGDWGTSLTPCGGDDMKDC